MSGLPRRLAAGVTLTAAWLNRLLDYLRSRELFAGPGIRLSRTPSGTTISVAPGGAAATHDAVPAVVKAAGNGVYTVDLHANGIGMPRTGTATLAVPEVSMLSTLDVGTVVLAHLVTISAAEAEESGGAGGTGQ